MTATRRKRPPLDKLGGPPPDWIPRGARFPGAVTAVPPGASPSPAPTSTPPAEAVGLGATTVDGTSTLADQFVDAVLSGATKRANDLGSRLVSAAFEEGDLGTLQSVGEGVLLREEQIPASPDDAPYDSGLGLDLLQSVVKPKRFTALMKGADMTEKELDLWRDLAAETLLCSSELDWDSYQMWCIRAVRHTDGRIAYLAETGGGYSFSEPYCSYEGAGTTLEAAQAHLQLLGFTDVEDYRSRTGRVRGRGKSTTPPTP